MPYLFRLLSLISSLILLSLANHCVAKVRPADLSLPTDHLGLGEGYATPGPIIDVKLWGGTGGLSDPFKIRSHLGIDVEVRTTLSLGQLGARWGLFTHSYEVLADDDQGLYSSNLSLDWRFVGGEGGVDAPYFGIGLSLPAIKLSGEGGFEGESQLDAYQVALASLYGGFNRWLWEPNTASAFIEAGGHAQWGLFAIEGEVAVAYLYRVLDSTVIETANVFAQAGGALGLQGDVWGFMIGGGYATAPLSAAEDFDQLHGRLELSYLVNRVSYYAQVITPIDAPIGLVGGEMGWSGILGIVGQL